MKKVKYLDTISLDDKDNMNQFNKREFIKLFVDMEGTNPDGQHALKEGYFEPIWEWIEQQLINRDKEMRDKIESMKIKATDDNYLDSSVGIRLQNKILDDVLNILDGGR